MSRISYLFIVVCTWISTPLNAQNTPLKAYIDQKTFYAPETGTFLEIHYQFVGHTLKYEGVEKGLQSKLAIHTVITNLSGDTVSKNQYVLQSPVMRDSIIEDFYDIQRLALPSGKYYALIELTDLIANAAPMTGIVEINVPDLGTKTVLSDIFIAEMATPTQTETVFSKSGYDLIPRLSNFYGQNLSSIPYYVEIYHSNRLTDSVFAIKQRIVSSEDNTEQMGFSKFTKLKTAPVIPIIRNLDISKLPTGSYRLELELLDRNNQSLCTPSTYYFERINEVETLTEIASIVLDPTFQQSITDDSLKYYLSSLIPIARPAEIKMILNTLKSDNLESYRKHIQQFWVQTSGTNAANAWSEYKKQVQLVEQLYGNNFQDGYETDRGRVYLQYGPPNSIVQREASSNEYPYEIWHYYKIKMYSNKRFVFYNPDLVNNAYRLLHSDMIGELKNVNWQQALSKRSNQSNDPDSGVPSTYGGSSNEYYRQY